LLAVAFPAVFVSIVISSYSDERFSTCQSRIRFGSIYVFLLQQMR
jgi:hypothetical protein